MNTPNLDDPQLLQQYDPEGMLLRLHEMPEHCQQAWHSHGRANQ